MNRAISVLNLLFLGLGLATLASTALAADDVLEVELFNATAQAISPDHDFGWLESPENSGHDFVIGPQASQELMYYLPKSRGTDTFTYRQGEQACHFGFGHLTPGADNPNRWAQAKSTGSVPVRCAAELIAIPDDDEFVSNGGTRVLFTMG